MELTRVERWLLSNQYQILEFVDEANATQYQENREVIEGGYEREYDAICQHIDDATLSPDECREVLDIRRMFARLQSSYDLLQTPSNVQQQDVAFPGFNGNCETKCLYYARYCGCFTELECVGDDLNSHRIPMLDRYRRMLAEWRASEDRNELTGEDLVRIIGVK